MSELDALTRQKVNWLNGYPYEIVSRAKQLVANNELGPYLIKKYPVAHDIRTDRELYNYAVRLQKEFMHSSPPILSVAYRPMVDPDGWAIYYPLIRDIKVSPVFRRAPIEFLRLLLLHELGHIEEEGHDEAFYRLHASMVPDYVQLHLDINLYMLHLDTGGVLYQ